MRDKPEALRRPTVQAFACRRRLKSVPNIPLLSFLPHRQYPSTAKTAASQSANRQNATLLTKRSDLYLPQCRMRASLSQRTSRANQPLIQSADQELLRTTAISLPIHWSQAALL